MTANVKVEYRVKVKTGALPWSYQYEDTWTTVKAGTRVDNVYLGWLANRTIKDYIGGSAELVSVEAIDTPKDTSSEDLMNEIMDKVSKTAEPIDIPEAPAVESISSELEQRDEDFAKKYLGNWLIKEFSNPKVLMRRYIKADMSDLTLWKVINKHRDLLENKGYKVSITGSLLPLSNYAFPVDSPTATITWGEGDETARTPIIVHEGYMPGQK